MSSDGFADRVLLLTGTTGIAAATARLAGRAGERVFIAGLDRASGVALCADLRTNGVDCRFVEADLRSAAAADGAVAACVEEFGRVDALFNVAGVSGRRFGDGPVHECTEHGWDTTLESNLKTVFLVCRAAIGRMLDQPIAANGQRGVVLNMASVLASSPEPRHFATHAYAASKAAIVGLTKSMAAYYAPRRIRVNAIAPSLVRTPMSQRAQANEEIVDFVRTKHNLVEDLIEPEDVASAALFLLRDDARAVTGEVLTVDAGWRLSG